MAKQNKKLWFPKTVIVGVSGIIMLYFTEKEKSRDGSVDSSNSLYNLK